jgi:Icc-related predicted phosphoesterase
MRPPFKTTPGQRAASWLRRTCASGSPCSVRYRAETDAEGFRQALLAGENEVYVASARGICSSMSDLHLEFHDVELPGGHVLLLAGDTLLVAPLREYRNDATSRALRKRFTRFAREELSKYDKVFFVLGNHEHYREVVEDVPGLLREFLAKNAPNATLLDDSAEVYEEVQFVGSTLWASYGAGTYAGWEIGRNMNDCKLIQTKAPLTAPGAVRFNGTAFHPHGPNWRVMTVDDFSKRHTEAQNFLKKTLRFSREQQLPAIVMTHHAPSYLSKTERFKHLDNGMDEAYYSNQHALIEDNPQIMAWIHGHTHDSSHYRIGRTLVISNQRGYFPSEQRSRHFDPNAENFDLDEIKKAWAEAGAKGTGQGMGAKKGKRANPGKLVLPARDGADR